MINNKKVLVCVSLLICLCLLLPCCAFDKGEQELSFASSNETTKKIYEYLCSIEKEKCLSAQQESTWMGSSEYEMDYIYSASGKYPAMRGLDYMNDDFEGVNERAADWWEKGGLVTICWHTGSDFSGAWEEAMNTEISDWDKALEDGTKENKQLLKGMDKAAKALSELKEKGVIVIWRPFHEADGGWFWWGKGGADNFVALWRLMYNRYTQYWKLDNLIWVMGFSHNGEDLKDWYPGDEYCDIIGADSYDGGAQEELYKAVEKCKAKNKPICFHECGENPSAQQLKDAGWLWFMTWHTEYLTDNNPPEKINELYNSDYIITLDELPSFGENQEDTTVNNDIKYYEVDNLLDTMNWLGKTEEETDVPEEYLVENGSFTDISFKGKLFGSECEGKTYFTSVGQEKETIQNVVIYCSSLPYNKCLEEFEKLYGQSVANGEQPYAESVGGVVEWTEFETDNCLIRVESASNYDFFTVEFRLLNG